MRERAVPNSNLKGWSHLVMDRWNISGMPPKMRERAKVEINVYRVDQRVLGGQHQLQ